MLEVAPRGGKQLRPRHARADKDWHPCFFHLRSRGYQLRMTKLTGSTDSVALLEAAISLTLTGTTPINKEAWGRLEARLRHKQAASLVATSLPGDRGPGRDLAPYLRRKGVCGICEGSQGLAEEGLEVLLVPPCSLAAVFVAGIDPALYDDVSQGLHVFLVCVVPRLQQDREARQETQEVGSLELEEEVAVLE